MADALQMLYFPRTRPATTFENKYIVYCERASEILVLFSTEFNPKSWR